MTESSGNPFADFGVDPDSVDPDPFSIKEVDTYPFVVTGAEVKKYNEIEYFVVDYSITEGKMAGRGARTMHRITPFNPGEEDFAVKKARAISNYKKSLMDLGLPEVAINAFNVRHHAQKLVGIRGTATFGPQKNNAAYNSVSNIKASSVAGPTESTLAPASTGVATESLSTENLVTKLGNWE
jgi:hypothetical protein